MPIRVLHVLGGLGRGGAESLVMNLYRHIDKEKVQFDFVIFEDGKLDFCEEILSMGGKVYKSPHYNGINTCDYVKFWKRFLDTHQEYRVVHGHVRSTASIYLSIAKKKGRITIAHSHSTSNGKGFSAFVKRILQYPIRYISDYQMACSYDAGMWLFGKNAINRKTFEIVKNGIDVNQFCFSVDMRTKKRKELAIDNQFVLCHVGRFSYPKNHQFIVELFKALSARCPEAVLILVGEGELEESIKRIILKEGLDKKVQFLGARTDIVEILNAADVFLFPSLYEGLGIAAIEAQAASLMTICSERIPREVFLTSYIRRIDLDEDQEKWIDAILDYREGYPRAGGMEEIKKAGYDIDQVSSAMQCFYLKLIA